MNGLSIAKINMAFFGEKEEIDRIETTFQGIRWELEIKKTDLYKKASLWIPKNEKDIEQFIEYLENKKELAKAQVMEIKE
jgi:hypothetical protein